MGANHHGPTTGRPHAATTGCPYPWCTTPHGATVHPDDEVHRSSGRSLTARISVDGRIVDDDAVIEVGVVRRDDDTHAWVVIEAGGATSFAISAAGARALRELLSADVELRSALDGDPRGS